MDLSDKNVLMYGAGLGDAWLAKRCKSLIVIERNEDWLYKAAENCVRNGAFVNYIHRPCNDSDGKADYYCEIPTDKDYHVIINDDAYRTEVVFKAIEYFKGKKYDGILICEIGGKIMYGKARQLLKHFQDMKAIFILNQTIQILKNPDANGKQQ